MSCLISGGRSRTRWLLADGSGCIAGELNRDPGVGCNRPGAWTTLEEADMTQAKAENHTYSRAFVAAGMWRVDPDAGLVYGKKGQAFRRTNSWGYIQIKFRDPDDWRQERAVLAHRVVWESVHNRLSNLEAVTQAENVRHAFATGLNRGRPGAESASARLTDDQVRDIYRRAWSGEPQADIGADFGVGYSIVSNIKRGWAWTHITGHAPTTTRRVA
jgi:hypothetical protein